MRGQNKKDPPKLPINNQDTKFPSFQNFTLNSQKQLKFSSPQEEYKHFKQISQQKTQQMNNKQKMYRIEVFKNNNMKGEIQRVDKEFQRAKYKITLQLLQKNKNNKDSPLFYNEHGLSPIQLTLVQQKKHHSGMEQSFVCMICFQDIQENQNVIVLPCEHCFHKDCAIQHLLGSRFCPNCSEIVDLLQHYKKAFQRKQF